VECNLDVLGDGGDCIGPAVRKFCTGMAVQQSQRVIGAIRSIRRSSNAHAGATTSGVLIYFYYFREELQSQSRALLSAIL
jgi:hypothetical protein